MFEREDWKLFRNIETLCQKAGVSKNDLKSLVLKELVDNSLDVSAHCEVGFLDEQNGFFVQDYGNGIPPEILENLFSINRPMITSKLLRLPTRGALGNGLRVVTGYVIATGGRLLVSTKGVKYEIITLPDGTARKEIIDSYSNVGTRIEIILGKYEVASKDMLGWGKNAILFSEGKQHTCKTSAFWYTSEAFFELLNAYTGTVVDLVSLFHGISSTKAKSIASKVNKTLTKNMSFEEADMLLTLIRDFSKKVSVGNLGFCGELPIGEYAKKTGHFELYSMKGLHDAEIPYIVETWVRYGGVGQEILVNKTPITGEVHKWHKNNSQTIYGCGIIAEIKMKKSQFAINIITPYMPITSDGKSPDFRHMNELIIKTLKSSTNKAKKLDLILNNDNAQNEKMIFQKHIQESIMKASGHGMYKFSQRQLYYAVRPYIINALDKQPEYGYFCRLLTEYENEYGDIPGLYRDPRGTLYHPHLRQDIPLGTIAVEEYERPKWTFNKIIYCEKEGFFPILKDINFPERFDCALLSSKGYASRAVKDLFDLLGDTDEEILFFCIHDSDSAGTMIYETLQNGTITRGKRSVTVINLGLDPWEALELGLNVEEFENKSRKSVAPYVKEESCRSDFAWDEWLQSKRVELNAMTTPQFIKWLESKIKEYDNGKVIPNSYILKDQLRQETNHIVRNKIMQDILEKNNFEEIVKQEQLKFHSDISNQVDSLGSIIEDDLNTNREQHWTSSIRTIAEKLVK